MSDGSRVPYPLSLLRVKTDPLVPDSLPTTALLGTTRTMPQAGGATHVSIQFMQATNAAPTAQLDGTGTSATVLVALQRSSSNNDGTPMSIVFNALHNIDESLVVEIPHGYDFGVYLSALVGANASTQRVNIYWSPIRR